jgi:hypothetical protein
MKMNGSHRLPPHGDQQYYEMIGKYHQYSPGWNDFTGGGVSDLSQISFFIRDCAVRQMTTIM